VVPFLVHSFTVARPKGSRSVAETLGAAMLALSACYIVLNEGFANWQSLWVCAVLAVLAFNLARARDAQG
jgi:glucan 1,3-beta-glucosidase